MAIRWQAFRHACMASFLVLVVLAACAPLPPAPISPVATPTSAEGSPNTPIQEGPMPTSTLPTATAVPGATQAPRPSNRDLAVADLAAELGIAPEAITVLAVEAVDWPDASLGCPKPGMMYAQVITPGYRIVLEVEGKIYEYHAGTSTIVRC